MELHPYVTASASASAPSLAMSSFEAIPSSQNHPGQYLRSTHSSASLNSSFHSGSNEIMPLRQLYHVEATLQNGGQEGRNGQMLGSTNNMGGDISSDGSSAYEGNFPQYMLPELANAGMQQDHLRQWTPLSAVNHRPGLYLDQDTSNGPSYVSTSRMSPGTLDVYSAQGNIFPALTNLSDTLPNASGSAPVQAYMRGDTRFMKQPEKITLPTIQGYPRSHSLDMSSLSTRSSSSTTLNDVSLAYNGSQYRNCSWAAEPSVSAPAAPIYTFSSPLKSRPLNIGGSHYSLESTSRGSPPILQPTSTLVSQSTTSPIIRFGTNYSTGYPSNLTSQSNVSYSISSENSSLLPLHPSTILRSPSVAGSACIIEVDKKRRANRSGEASRGPSSDSTGSSVPASPYSTSPTASLYGTSRSQPATPVPTRSASDKGLHTHSSQRRHLNTIY